MFRWIFGIYISGPLQGKSEEIDVLNPVTVGESLNSFSLFDVKLQVTFSRYTNEEISNRNPVAEVSQYMPRLWFLYNQENETKRSIFKRLRIAFLHFDSAQA